MRRFSLWQNLSCLSCLPAFPPWRAAPRYQLAEPLCCSLTTAGPRTLTPRAFCIPLSAHTLEVDGIVPWDSSVCLLLLLPHCFQQRFEMTIIFRDAWLSWSCKKLVCAWKTCILPAPPRGCLCLTSEVHDTMEVTQSAWRPP